MKVIAILHRSAGNESVGDMWRETKIFEGIDTIEEIIKWSMKRTSTTDTKYLNYHLEISVPKD